MENEMPVVVETEHQSGTVKLKTVEMDSESVGVDQITWKQEVKYDNYDENKDKIFSNSAFKQKSPIKEYHMVCTKLSRKSFSCYNCNYTACCKNLLRNHIRRHKIQESIYLHRFSYKLSICIRCKAAFKSKQGLDEHIIGKHPLYIASVSSKIHECIHCTYKTTMKCDFAHHMLEHPETCTHCNAKFGKWSALNNHIIKIHPDLIASVSRKIYECMHCTYKTTTKSDLARHRGNKHKLSTCIHCDATFKYKQNLDDHIIKKHPDFIELFPGKIYKCAHCSYKTTIKHSLARHMWKHPEAAGGYKLSTCIHCNTTFRNKSTLDDHVIKKHPDFIASVTSRIHKCTHCTYKTTMKEHLARHMLKHPETAGNYKLSICIHCNKTFKNKQRLDGHIIIKHPEFITSVSSKIHECTHCPYKTTGKGDLDKHISSNHPQTSGSYKLSTCMLCGATFKIKRSLDEHIVNKHPHLITSVSSKIYECTHCAYKTTIKHSFARHTLKHPETAGSYKLSICVNCNATFRKKRSLDNHIIRVHPELIAHVSSKIHECTHCTYKTTIKIALAKHMLQHPHTSSTYKLSTCIHCDATFKVKQNLEDHIIKKHPAFIASVPSKIHECTHCTYKTTLKHGLIRHMLKHAEKYGSMCMYCDAKFKSKQGLDDHIIKKHPGFTASVPSKIHECTYCAYKTTRKNTLDRHMLKHPETAVDHKLSTCVNCNATFKSKKSLDDHTVREHPYFIASVSNKIHECKNCLYKTTKKSNLARHMLKHNIRS